MPEPAIRAIRPPKVLFAILAAWATPLPNSFTATAAAGFSAIPIGVISIMNDNVLPATLVPDPGLYFGLLPSSVSLKALCPY